MCQLLENKLYCKENQIYSMKYFLKHFLLWKEKNLIQYNCNMWFIWNYTKIEFSLSFMYRHQRIEVHQQVNLKDDLPLAMRSRSIPYRMSLTISDIYRWLTQLHLGCAPMGRPMISKEERSRISHILIRMLNQHSEKTAKPHTQLPTTVLDKVCSWLKSDVIY